MTKKQPRTYKPGDIVVVRIPAHNREPESELEVEVIQKHLVKTNSYLIRLPEGGTGEVDLKNIKRLIKPADFKADNSRDPLKVQVDGDHYKQLKIQPIEFIQANELGFEAGNVVKYVTRYKHKNGIKDLEKAIHYLEFLISKETRELEARAAR